MFPNMQQPPVIFMQPLQNFLNGIVGDFSSDYYSEEKCENPEQKLRNMVVDAIIYGYERSDPTVVMSLNEIDCLFPELSGIASDNSLKYVKSVESVLNNKKSDLLQLGGPISPVEMISRMMGHMEEQVVNYSCGELAEKGITLKRYNYGDNYIEQQK